MSLYNLNDLKNNLRKEIEKADSLAGEWEKVTFPTKKDGKPFAVMSKNIDGANYRLWTFAHCDYEHELSVCVSTKMSGYIHDDIKAYDYVKYMKDDDPRLAKTENIVEDYGSKVYKFDLDDIKEAIRKRAEYLRNRSADLTKQLESADRIYEDFREAYGKAMDILKESCKDFICCDLEYDLKEMIKDRYPYA